jgi:hypothetical protein
MNQSAAPTLNLHPLTPLDSADPASPLDPLKSGHPRNGKIAQMPREQRDALNRMLSNGAPYDSIIDHFHSLGTELNRQNISNWKAGGYEDWLAQQAWLAEINHESESASDLANAGGVDDTALHQGVIRLAVIQIFKSLKSERLKDDAPNYTRLLNTLARLSREALCLRKHSEACAAAQAALAPAKDPKRELSDEDRRAIVHHVDRVLGLAPDRPMTPAPQPSPRDPDPNHHRFPDGDPVPPTSDDEHSASDPIGSSGEGHPLPTHTGEDINISHLIPPGLQMSPMENQKPEIENLLPESTVIDLVPISDPVASDEPPQTTSQTPMPSSDSSQDQPPAELGSNQSGPPHDQPIIAPVTESCQQCGQELPPLLPNGERPDPWCPNPRCQTSLPDPPRQTVPTHSTM